MSEVRPPLPPFTQETAVQKVRAAEDGWNSCNPERVSLAYTVDSAWRNRSEFFRPPQDRGIPDAEMESRARLSPDQGIVDLRREPYRRALLLRIPRRFRQLGSRLRERELGVRRTWPDAAAPSFDQRPADPGRGPEIPLGPQRPKAQGSPRPWRTRLVGAKESTVWTITSRSGRRTWATRFRTPPRWPRPGARPNALRAGRCRCAGCRPRSRLGADRCLRTGREQSRSHPPPR